MLDKLLEFCRKYDLVPTKLDDDTFKKVLGSLLSKGRIIVVTDNHGEIVGYVESWRVTFEQFGKIICHEFFDIMKEDVEHGNICYLSNTAIHPTYRGNGVVRQLKEKFMELNKDCEYYVGQALRKKHQPVKVFKRKELYDGK